MKVSLNWIKEFVGIDLPVDELVEKIGAQLGAVEEVEYIGEKYKGIFIARVVKCEKHPNADKLSVCLIDDGGAMQSVTRKENGLVEVVCGAPNVKADMLVVWLPPGTVVPSTFNKDPLKLEAREIRGVVSNGMLASAHELALSDDHSGIVELSFGEPGEDFAVAVGLDDYILDIENKMFTHRPDCFGILGVAREVAGITGQQFKSPEWYVEESSAPAADSTLQLMVNNQIPQQVSRFMAQVIEGVDVKASPVWMQAYLTRVGIRPINNIVDVTNYAMYLTAQPLHAYDYDKLTLLAGSGGKEPGVSLETRLSRNGDTLTLLNGRKITFEDNETILITSNDVPVGIGGVMGGADTEVDETTKNIVLECANFDMYAIRRASMRHGLFTDAVTRFNKGQSSLQNAAVLLKTAGWVTHLAGGKSGGAIDTGRKTEHPAAVQVTDAFINARLGLELSAEEMASILSNVEFETTVQGSTLYVTPPFWRTDIEIPEDVVEEVGRLYGYDKLPLELPKRDLTPANKNELLELKSRIRDVLSKAGANEVLTYSFVHGNLLDAVGQDKTQAFELSNALSPDLQYYRMSLTPSLLDKVHSNIKSGYEEFALFEIGKAHIKGEHTASEPDLPAEFQRLAFVFAANQKSSLNYQGAPYYQARKYLFNVLEAFDIAGRVKIEPLQPERYVGATHTKTTQYEPARAATVRLGDAVIGEIGEYKPTVKRALKLPEYTAGFELDISSLRKLSDNAYLPIPRFPKVEQDISLKVPAKLLYGELFDFVRATIESLKPAETLASLEPLDIYQREDDEAHKQVALRLSIASYERTMTAEEVNGLLNKVAEAAKDKFGAIRI
jgi:phenylalanyl-tRNA synthetase beta chain